MNWESTIKGCKKKDQRHQQALVHQLGPKLKGICLRYIQTPYEIEEIIQQSLIKILTHIDQYNESLGNFEGWAKRICLYTLFAYLKSEKKGRIVQGYEHVPEISVAPEAYKRLEAEEVMELLHSLPPHYRNVLCLYSIEGYSHKEIAELMGIAESTSRSHLTRARKMLKAKINLNKQEEIYATRSPR